MKKIVVHICLYPAYRRICKTYDKIDERLLGEESFNKSLPEIFHSFAVFSHLSSR